MGAPSGFAPGQPVQLVDRLQVRPGCQQAVFELMTLDYASHVSGRGLRLVGAWLSPPFERPGMNSELTVIWEHASLAALWSGRMAEEDDPVASRVWSALGPLTDGRTRHLARNAPMALPPPEQAGRLSVAANGPLRTILLVRPTTPPGEAELPQWISAAEGVARRTGILASRIGLHGDYSFLAGHLTWDIASDEAVAPLELLAALPGPAELVEAVTLGKVLSEGDRSPTLSGIKRTILVRVRDGIDAATQAAFEHALADTPLWITGIRNWRLSRVASSTGPVGWTHCFEQEVEDATLFVGDYLNHPYHWAVVERLFHPDAPERVGDAFLHTLIPIDRPVLSEMS